MRENLHSQRVQHPLPGASGQQREPSCAAHWASTTARATPRRPRRAPIAPFSTPSSMPCRISTGSSSPARRPAATERRPAAGRRSRAAGGAARSAARAARHAPRRRPGCRRRAAARPPGRAVRGWRAAPRARLRSCRAVRPARCAVPVRPAGRGRTVRCRALLAPATARACSPVDGVVRVGAAAAYRPGRAPLGAEFVRVGQQLPVEGAALAAAPSWVPTSASRPPSSDRDPVGQRQGGAAGGRSAASYGRAMTSRSASWISCLDRASTAEVASSSSSSRGSVSRARASAMRWR